MSLPGFTPPAVMTVRQHRGYIYVRPRPERPAPRTARRAPVGPGRTRPSGDPDPTGRTSPPDGTAGTGSNGAVAAPHRESGTLTAHAPTPGRQAREGGRPPCFRAVLSGRSVRRRSDGGGAGQGGADGGGQRGVMPVARSPAVTGRRGRTGHPDGRASVDAVPGKRGGDRNDRSPPHVTPDRPVRARAHVRRRGGRAYPVVRRGRPASRPGRRASPRTGTPPAPGRPGGRRSGPGRPRPRRPARRR